MFGLLTAFRIWAKDKNFLPSDYFLISSLCLQAVQRTRR